MLIRGAPVGMSYVVMVGVIRLTGTSCCLWVAGFGGCGSTGLGGSLNDASRRFRCAVVIVGTWGGYDGGSVRGRCG